MELPAFRELFCNAKDAMYIYELFEDANVGYYLDVNETATSILGYSKQELLQMKPTELTASECIPNFKQVVERLMQEGKLTTEWVHVHKSGRQIPVEISASVSDWDGRCVVFCISRDITERKQMEKLLKVSEQRYKSLFEHNPDAIYQVDRSGRFIRVNQMAQKLTGYTPEELVGINFTQLIVPEDVDKAVYHFSKAYQGERQSFEIAITNLSGQRLDLNINSTPIVVDGEITGLYGIAKDITEKKRAAEKVEFFTFYDALTGLPNRNFFKERLEAELQQARFEDKMLSVMMIDVDRFKIVNDTLGHAAGDLLLKEVSKRLANCVGADDMVSRMSGDEFTILLSDIAHTEDAQRMAQKIMSAVADPLKIDAEHEFQMTASIGISVYPHDGDDTETLIKHADIAMYRAKEEGRNNHQFYNSEMNTKSYELMVLENELRRAVDRQEFFLMYQPQVNIRTGEIFGFEALVRWKHPQMGIVPPGSFIPMAEETGLIVPIGKWVLKTACQQAKAWESMRCSPLRIAVNLSMRQFLDEDLVKTVKQVLEETGLDPSNLELEITESVAMNNVNLVIEKLQALKKLGLHISIDDFGTGYSSLSYLSKFSIDSLKIDRSFVMNCDLVIISAIISLAHKMQLQVIAEGVETSEQLAFLQEQECDEVQGYLFGKPMTAEELEERYLTMQEEAVKLCQNGLPKMV